MQRAASSKSDSPKQPASESQNKRRRVDGHSRNATPHRSETNTPLSHFANRVMEERSAQATNTPAREGEDTEWVLDVKVPQANGHDDVSESEDDIWSTKAMGRQTFGAFKRHKNVPVKPARDDADADLSSASEGEISDSPPSRQSKGGPGRSLPKNVQRQGSDTASPLRLHAQKQERKRKQPQPQSTGRKKARKTM